MGTSPSTKSTGGPSTGVDLNNPTINNASDFSTALLAELGNLQGVNITPSSTAINLVNAWQATEGQWGASGEFNSQSQHNPLNIESTAPGSPSGKKICASNNACTLSFSNWADGVKAAAQFILTYQPAIATALLDSSSKDQAKNFLSVVGAWNPQDSSYATDIQSNYGKPVPGGTSTTAASSKLSVGDWLQSYAAMLYIPPGSNNTGIFKYLPVLGSIFGIASDVSSIGSTITAIVARGGTFLVGAVVFSVGLIVILGSSLTDAFHSSLGKAATKAVVAA